MANKGHTVMQKLILYLSTDDLSLSSWATSSAQGVIEKSVLHGSREDLQADALDKEVIVIPPAQDVLLTAVKLPKLNRYRLLQALPYALEEQLLTDVSALHFAIGDYQPDGTVPVAIVTRHKMDNWLTELKKWGIFPTLMLPALLATPYFENSWNIFVVDHLAIARTGLYSGFTCDQDNIPALVEMELAQCVNKPQTIYLQNYTSDRLELTLTASHIIEKQFAPKNFIEDVALKLAAPFINLCQGTYQKKHKPSQNKKIWQLAAYALSVWVGLVFISNTVSYGILQHQSATLQKQINTIYRRNFPHASAMVSPKDRLSEKLNNLQHQGNKNHLLIWLSFLGKSLPDAHGLHLQQLEYRNGVLSLDIAAKNFDAIDQLAKALAQEGLEVKQQNVGAAGNSVKGSLIITENRL
jgi:general secretion pathway protein L